MTTYDSTSDDGPSRAEENLGLRPVPRIAIQAFCETPDVATVLEKAAADRRMNKAHVKIHMGGSAAALDFYASAPTPGPSPSSASNRNSWSPSPNRPTPSSP